MYVFRGGNEFPTGVVADTTAHTAYQGKDVFGRFGAAFVSGRFQIGTGAVGAQQIAIAQPRASAAAPATPANPQQMAGVVRVYTYA